jgi:excisionase family DNA binding protein
MSTSGEEFLTVAEIAEILKLNQQTVRNWIDGGTLPAYHVGRRVRVPRSAFDALLERSRTAQALEAQQGQARDFWEGELVPTPAVEREEAE